MVPTRAFIAAMALWMCRSARLAGRSRLQKPLAQADTRPGHRSRAWADAAAAPAPGEVRPGLDHGSGPRRPGLSPALSAASPFSSFSFVSFVFFLKILPKATRVFAPPPRCVCRSSSCLRHIRRIETRLYDRDTKGGCEV